MPQKFVQARHKAAPVPVTAEKPRTNRSWIIASVVIIVAALALGGFLLSRRSAPVASGSASSAIPVATPPVTAPTAIPEKSIAVLPFENLSDEKQNAYFTDGVQDEILTALARIAELNALISRSSVMQYKTGVARSRKIGQNLAWRICSKAACSGQLIRCESARS
jgi:hypothetical protein